MSVEDKGEGISFNVFCYNVQPGITIDYATGSSELAESDDSDASAAEYVLNTNTKKFHFPGCTSVSDISQENRQDYTGSRDMLIAQGYSPCGRCNP
jgi:DNA-entry nuclease